MATVPPGPSSALPATPAEIPPFPAAGSAEPAVEDGEPACSTEDRVTIDPGKKSQPVNEVKTSLKNKQKNMLARASPAALHLKVQAGEQQLNGLASPSEDGDSHQHTENRPDNPRPSADNCDNAAGPDGKASPAEPQRPPAAEMARLDLGSSPGRAGEESHGIRYVRYESELQMPWIMRLITKDLSEPYSIYTYRYFIHNWPQLCFLAMVEQECVGAIVCKLDMHKKMFRRGYIAMLAVDSKHRRKSIGTNLVKKAIYAMVEGDCDEVVLETEITNKSALKLYENLGFVRDKRLFRYYLNGVDALRLKLWLR
uniref:N-alpha-acetyltransferase 30 n=1 Tax=Mola mola TaxID=94237 RepID=A0A3Q3VTL6_MOLML